MDKLTCTICNDNPVFTDEVIFWEHLEVAHLIHHYKCDDTATEGLEKAINSILRPN